MGRRRAIRRWLTLGVSLTVVALGLQATAPGVAGAQSQRQADPLAGQGGTLSCGGTYNFTMDAGTSGTAAVTTAEGVTGCTLSGVIPSGWSVDLLGVPLTLDSNSGNAGSLIVENTGAHNPMLTGGSFESEGQVDLDDTNSNAQFNADVSGYTNLPGGTLATNGGFALVFDYDNATTAGSFVNQGAVTVGQDGNLQIGVSGCTSGTVFTNDEGGSVTVDSGGEFYIGCGGVVINGGTVSAPVEANGITGPIETSDSPVSITFGPSVPADSTGTIADASSLTTLGGVIASGWTVNVTNYATTVNAATGSGNAGTLDMGAGGEHLEGTGTFDNSATLDVVSGGTIDVADLINSGTIDNSAPSGRSGLTFGYDGGTIHNSGTISVGTNQYITVGSQDCVTGEDLIEGGANSSLVPTGDIYMQCGELDLDGGSITSAGPVLVEPVGQVLVDFDTGLGADTGPTGSDTLETSGGGVTMEGAIPAGWTLDALSSLTVNAGSSNAGTIELNSGFTDTGGFVNSGTMEVPQGGSATLNVADLTNTASGLIESAGTANGGSELTFGYDNASTAGILDNSGTLSVNGGEFLTVGPQDCKTGEQLILEPGSTVAADGSFDMQCGQLDVKGGTVTSAGPIDVSTVGTVSINFASGLPAGTGGAGDTIELASSQTGGTPITSGIPAGWTIYDNGGSFTVPNDAVNSGTIDLNYGGGLLGVQGGVQNGTFTNAGTINVTGGIGAFVNFSGQVVNTGTVSIAAGGDSWDLVDASFLNSGTLNIDHQSNLHFDNYTQNALGTLDLTLDSANGSYGSVNASANASLGGTLALTTVGTPTLGNIFYVVECPGTTSGQFANVTGTLAGNGLGYQVNYNPGSSNYTTINVVAASVLTGLTASDVTIPTPSPLAPGQPFTASFTVTNTGTQAASGGWEDSVYLGTGNSYQAGDTLVARIPHTTTLAPGASYTDDVNVTLPLVAAGTYSLIVVPDSADNVASTADDQQAASGTFTVTTIPTLTVGTPVDTTVQSSQNLYYQVTVPSGQDVRITVSLPSGKDAELYAATGNPPSPSAYTMESTPGAASPTITLPGSTPGTWYLDLHGLDPAGSGVAVIIDPEDVGLSVSGVTPGSAANAGPVTLTIEGAGFGSDLSASLVKGSTTVAATSVDRQSSTTAFASFDLAGAAVGTYDLKLTTGGHSTTDEGALDVTSGGGGGLQISLTGGGDLRYGWIGDVTLHLTNTGDDDVYIPEIDVPGANGDVISLSDLQCGSNGVCLVPPGDAGFEPSITLLDPNFSVPGQPPLPPGVLPPGASATLSFGVLSTTTVSNATITVDPTVVNSTDQDSIDWATLLAPSEPPGMSAIDWSGVVSSFSTTYGTTVGAYATALVHAYAEAQADGVVLSDQSDALGFLLDEQLATWAGAPVTGTVHLSQTSLPLGKASMTLTSTSGTSVYTTTSWYDGRFAFFDVPAGSYDLGIDGYLPRPIETVNVSPTAHGLTVIAQPGATLTGTVTEQDGVTPVVGATVTATDGAGAVNSTPTGADGSYTISGLEPGSVTVSASASGHELTSGLTATTALGAPTTLDIALEQDGAISGTITAPGGGEPTAATVDAQPVSGGSITPGTVGSGGSFTIANLVPGQYTVNAEAPGDGPAQQSPVTVTAGPTTSSVDLALTSPPATVSGVVTDADTGEPIPDALVSTDAANGASGPVTTGSDGSYTLSGLSGGTIDISVVPPDTTHLAATTTADGVPGSVTTADVQLDPAGTLSATVEKASGSDNPLSGATVEVVGPSPGGTETPEQSQSLITDSSGQVSLTGLSAGSYDLQVEGSDAHQAFAIGPDKRNATVTLTVPTGTVSGQVINSEGAPASGVQVTLADATGPVVGTTTDSNGDYSFTVSAAGTMDVIAADSSIGVLIASGVAVATGQATTVPTLQAGKASLDVTVTSGGNPVNGASVTVSTGSANDQPATVGGTTDGTGTAVLDNLTPGSYELAVSDGTDATDLQQVTVSSGSNAVAAAMGAGGAIAGTVQDTSSNSVSGATVVAVGQTSGLDFATTTGTDGTYNLGNLPADTYSLSVSAKGDAPTDVTGVAVTAGNQAAADVTLPTTGSTLTVSLAANAAGPLPGLNAILEDSTGIPVNFGNLGPAVNATDTADQATFGPLTPGSYTLVVSGPGRATSTLPVTVSTGTNTSTVTTPAGEVLPPTSAGSPSARPTMIVPGTAFARDVPALVETLAADSDSVPSAWEATKFFFQSWSNLIPNPNLVYSPNIYSGVDKYQNALARYNDLVSTYNALCFNPNLNQALQYLNIVRQALGKWEGDYNYLQNQSLENRLTVAGDASSALGGLAERWRRQFPPGPHWVRSASPAQCRGYRRPGSSHGSSAGQPNVPGVRKPVSSRHHRPGCRCASEVNTAIEAALKSPAARAGSAAVGHLLNFLNVWASVKVTLEDAEKAMGQMSATVADANAAQGVFNTFLAELNAALQAASSYVCPSKHHGPPPPPPPPPPYPVKPPIGYTNNLGFDPNGIDGPPGAGPARWIQPNSGLGYTIHFQNDPSASASVAQVSVTEPVPPDVDPASVQLTGFGYGSTAVVVPAGHQSFTETLPDSAPNGDGDTVNVTGSYDQATSTITWTMTAINPATGDADTSATGGFLPPDSLPNRDGEGYVSFTVNPKAGLGTGTEVTAAASIVFDRNSAISTPTWTNTIDGTTPTARVAPLASTTTAGALKVTWTGSDPSGSACRPTTCTSAWMAVR